MSAIYIATTHDVEEYREKVATAALQAHTWIAKQSSDPLEFLRDVKFLKKGHHPITGHPLNLIEQVNQTWTYLVALAATSWLLKEHPDAGGFDLAPGATASQELDIMSRNPLVVAAETFAATHPDSNKKLKKDLAKLTLHAEYHNRYVFFASPAFPETLRLQRYESDGIKVWSLRV